MSHLLVVTRPHLAAGFQLAGVEAYPADDFESARELLEDWLQSGLRGLCAIDEEYLEHLPRSLVQRLDRSDRLRYISIPGGRPLDRTSSRRHRIARLLRLAIGFHIAFEPEADGAAEHG